VRRRSIDLLRTSILLFAHRHSRKQLECWNFEQHGCPASARRRKDCNPSCHRYADCIAYTGAIAIEVAILLQELANGRSAGPFEMLSEMQ
jgi:hypothetical protein